MYTKFKTKTAQTIFLSENRGKSSPNISKNSLNSGSQRGLTIFDFQYRD